MVVGIGVAADRRDRAEMVGPAKLPALALVPDQHGDTRSRLDMLQRFELSGLAISGDGHARGRASQPKKHEPDRGHRQPFGEREGGFVLEADGQDEDRNGEWHQPHVGIGRSEYDARKEDVTRRQDEAGEGKVA
jgi:hypothetical protein